jgi:hypothetical protein
MNFGGFGKIEGRMAVNELTYSEIVDTYDRPAHEILRPFHERLWGECGKDRPDKELLY